MPNIEELQKLVDDAQAALKAAGVEAAPVAEFSASQVTPEPAEATFQSGTDHELSHVEGSISDTVDAVGDATQVVADVEAGKPLAAVAPATDLVSEIHAMVSDIHAFIEGLKPFASDLAPIVEKLGNSPMLKMFGV